MRKLILILLLVFTLPAAADPLDAPRDVHLVTGAPLYTGAVRQKKPAAARARSDFADTRPGAARPGALGGGFIEFLFSSARNGELPRSRNQRPWEDMSPHQDGANGGVEIAPRRQDARREEPRRVRPHYAMDPRYLKQEVEYQSKEKPGTLIVDTPNKFLYFIEGDGKAIRYGIGVGRPGFEWAGVKTVSAKKEWPDWRPPAEMLARRPDLPKYMPGGPSNPLGARAMYLGSTLYRIHGSNEPQTIGHAVSSGCIRMRNEDVIDLYEKVKVGAKVIVI
jgi:lipoprotein-anchoring transpeptidase ErfK/SrfK